MTSHLPQRDEGGSNNPFFAQCTPTIFYNVTKHFYLRGEGEL